MKKWFELYSSGNIDSEKVQQLVGQIPWGQNVLIITKSKDIEDQLVKHITSFLLELGTGFSFVGRQVPLEIDGHDFYIDLLFYWLWQ